jgi:hypothetical protein
MDAMRVELHRKYTRLRFSSVRCPTHIYYISRSFLFLLKIIPLGYCSFWQLCSLWGCVDNYFLWDFVDHYFLWDFVDTHAERRNHLRKTLLPLRKLRFQLATLLPLVPPRQHSWHRSSYLLSHCMILSSFINLYYKFNFIFIYSNITYNYHIQLSHTIITYNY